MTNSMSADENLSAAEKEVFETSEAWSRALAANDPDVIASFMADDWVMVSELGVSSKERFMSFVSSGQLTHDSMDLAELSRITVYGDMAVLVARVTNVADFAGQRFDANEWTSDVFRKTADGWKCVMTHITPVKPLPGTA